MRSRLLELTIERQASLLSYLDAYRLVGFPFASLRPADPLCRPLKASFQGGGRGRRGPLTAPIPDIA